MNEYEELKHQTEQDNLKEKEKGRRLYRYARDNGFTYTEARRLCQSSKEKIDRVIKLRDK